MKTNLGTLDRTLRILFALLIAGLYIAGLISGTATIILLVVASIFILTGFIGFCPIYYAAGISSRKKMA